MKLPDLQHDFHTHHSSVHITGNKPCTNHQLKFSSHTPACNTAIAWPEIFIHSFKSFNHSFNQSIIHSFNHSIIHSIIHSFIQSCNQSFNHSAVHSCLHRRGIHRCQDTGGAETSAGSLASWPGKEEAACQAEWGDRELPSTSRSAAAYLGFSPSIAPATGGTLTAITLSCVHRFSRNKNERHHS